MTNKSTLHPVIVDGDFGGDEMQLLAVLLAHAEKFKILGATAVFGNTNHDQVLENAGAILRLLNADDIVPRFGGARAPLTHPLGEGDNAHGADGIGGVVLPLSRIAPSPIPAVDFMLNQLCAYPSGTVTITATGPLTNIAEAIHKDIGTMRRARQIVIMGACTEDMPAHDMPLRRGNITPEAEFNFFMAPEDAATVLESGLPLVVFPMNCTHQLTFTPERQDLLRRRLSHHPHKAELIDRLLRSAEYLDRMKFNASNVMHDVHTALFLLDPDLYEGQIGTLSVSATGRTDFTAHPKGAHHVMDRCRTPDKLFDIIMNAFETVLDPHFVTGLIQKATAYSHLKGN